jgi:pyridoxine 5-phosphate synthase
MKKTKLSVNINKIATLRNARGGNDPSVILAAKKIQEFGAHGITVHPRPDERHITLADVHNLKPIVTTEYNIEGYPSDAFLDLIQEIKPDQVTLVPDPPDAITSNAGWNVSLNQKFLADVFKKISISSPQSRISVFIDPQSCSLEELKILKAQGVHRIELYTEAYAKAFEQSGADPSLTSEATKAELEVTLSHYVKIANHALSVGLGINAGHDLNQKNLGLFIKTVPEVDEVSIGHALISESLYLGLEKTIKNYLIILKS